MSIIIMFAAFVAMAVFLDARAFKAKGLNALVEERKWAQRNFDLDYESLAACDPRDPAYPYVLNHVKRLGDQLWYYDKRLENF